MNLCAYTRNDTLILRSIHIQVEPFLLCYLQKDCNCLSVLFTQTYYKAGCLVSSMHIFLLYYTNLICTKRVAFTRLVKILRLLLQQRASIIWACSSSLEKVVSFTCMIASDGFNDICMFDSWNVTYEWNDLPNNTKEKTITFSSSLPNL